MNGRKARQCNSEVDIEMVLVWPLIPPENSVLQQWLDGHDFYGDPMKGPFGVLIKMYWWGLQKIS